MTHRRIIPPILASASLLSVVVLLSCGEGKKEDLGVESPPTCDAGFEDYGAGECLPTDPCAAEETCAAQHRECTNNRGAAVCGPCAGGYREAAGGCVESETCADNSCSGHGDCDDATGIVVCTCDAAYEGDDCGSCAANYRTDGEDGCEPDPTTAVVTLTPDGGTYATPGGWIVTAPEGAVEDDVTITIHVDAIDGAAWLGTELPLKEALVLAVSFSPDGQVFDEPLEIFAPTTVLAFSLEDSVVDEVVFAGLTGDRMFFGEGNEVVEVDELGLTFRVEHFSEGAWWDLGQVKRTLQGWVDSAVTTAAELHESAIDAAKSLVGLPGKLMGPLFENPDGTYNCEYVAGLALATLEVDRSSKHRLYTKWFFGTVGVNEVYPLSREEFFGDEEQYQISLFNRLKANANPRRAQVSCCPQTPTRTAFQETWWEGYVADGPLKMKQATMVWDLILIQKYHFELKSAHLSCDGGPFDEERSLSLSSPQWQKWDTFNFNAGQKAYGNWEDDWWAAVQECSLGFLGRDYRIESPIWQTDMSAYGSWSRLVPGKEYFDGEACQCMKDMADVQLERDAENRGLCDCPKDPNGEFKWHADSQTCVCTNEERPNWDAGNKRCISCEELDPEKPVWNPVTKECMACTVKVCEGDHSVTSPEDLEALTECTSVAGALEIKDSPLTGLDELVCLTAVGGALTIQNNADLTTLAGLQNVISVGDLVIDNNDALEALNGVGGIKSLTGTLKVKGNAGLKSLTGLNNITSVNDLVLDDNDALTTLDALSGITTVGGELSIWNHEILKTLNGLHNVEFVGTWLQIGYNNSLETLAALGNVTTVGLWVGVHYNDVLTNLEGLNNIASGPGIGIFGGEQLESLGALSNITFVNDKLIVESTTVLKGLHGLHNIESVGIDLYVQYNEGLESLEALSGLRSVAETVMISGNDKLINLDGLENATMRYLSLYYTPVLSDLEALGNLTALDQLTLSGNLALQKLKGLEGLVVLGDLNILNNPILDSLEPLAGVTALMKVGTHDGDLWIAGNAALKSMDGLNKISRIDGHVWLKGTALEDLDGLGGLRSVGDNFWVWENEDLASWTGLTDLKVDGGVRFADNPLLCVDPEELVEKVTIGGALDLRGNKQCE